VLVLANELHEHLAAASESHHHHVRTELNLELGSAPFGIEPVGKLPALASEPTPD
jgi:hypothetical protein